MFLLKCVFSFFFSSRRRHTIWPRDWSSDVCSSDLIHLAARHCHAIIQQAAQEIMYLESLRNSGNALTNALQFSQWHPGISVVSPLGTQERRPVSSVFVLIIC